jgi:hypothetical protein
LTDRRVMKALSVARGVDGPYSQINGTGESAGAVPTFHRLSESQPYAIVSITARRGSSLVCGRGESAHHASRTGSLHRLRRTFPARRFIGGRLLSQWPHVRL